MTLPQDTFLTRLDAYLALAEKATPGPWIKQDEATDEEVLKNFILSKGLANDDDDTFIAASRTVGPEAARFAKEAAQIIEGLLNTNDYASAGKARALLMKYGIEVKG